MRAPLRLATSGLLGLAVVASLAVLSPATASADEVTATASTSSTPATAPPVAADESPEAILDQADAFVSGTVSPLARLLQRRTTGATDPVEGTLVMRDLYRVADDLGGSDRARAQQLLARPTDGARDPFGDGYSATSERACSRRVCIHWTPDGVDAPPGRSWVTKTLQVMNKVWRTEVTTLGFRAPLSDGRRGGDGRFDVYLEDLGTTGAYGYCTPDGAARGATTTAAGYCVLDNDFSPSQYVGAPALTSLRVTAAHEFFHAVQFAYDYTEDPWFMESTAVWMEERVAGNANDNRQYLSYGQLVDPRGPLDHFEGDGFTQYGNWVWWEYLSQRFGRSIVRQVWDAAAAGPGRRGDYSTAALRAVLSTRGGFARVFADYASATTDATRSYREGTRWPAAAPEGSLPLTAAEPSRTTRTRIDHMASSSYVFVPDAATLSARRWTLAVAVRGPRRVTSPVAQVRVAKADGTVVDRAVRLDRSGRGRTRVPFGASGVQRVTVTLANASTRFRCGRGPTTWSCHGKPRDDRQRFVLRVAAVLR